MILTVTMNPSVDTRYPVSYTHLDVYKRQLVPITAGITSNMAINGNAAAPIIFLVIFNAVQFALRF